MYKYVFKATVDQYSGYVCIHSLAYLCMHTAPGHVHMTYDSCDSMHVYITAAKDAVDSNYNQIWSLMSSPEKHGTDSILHARMANFLSLVYHG